MKPLNPELKRHLISFGVTFAAAFAIAVLPQLDSITLTSLENGAIVGVILAGVRAGVKAMLETFIAWYSAR